MDWLKAREASQASSRADSPSEADKPLVEVEARPSSSRLDLGRESPGLPVDASPEAPQAAAPAALERARAAKEAKAIHVEPLSVDVGGPSRRASDEAIPLAPLEEGSVSLEEVPHARISQLPAQPSFTSVRFSQPPIPLITRGRTVSEQRFRSLDEESERTSIGDFSPDRPARSERSNSGQSVDSDGQDVTARLGREFSDDEEMSVKAAAAAATPRGGSSSGGFGSQGVLWRALKDPRSLAHACPVRPSR